MNLSPARKFVLAFVFGLIAVFGFAPFSLFPLPILALSMLFWLWLQATSTRQAVWLGFVFGMGLFCGGVGWIYVALHDYGDMNFILALLGTALFCAVNATLPALAGYVQAKMRAPIWVRMALLMPASWVLMEWLRGLLFTGFPWLSAGYSQVPNSPLAGYAPTFGVFGARPNEFINNANALGVMPALLAASPHAMS